MLSSFFKNIKSGHIGGLSGRLVMDLTGLPLTQEQESWLKDRVIEDSKLSLPTIENEYSLSCEFLFHFYFDCELNLKYEFENDGTFELPSELIRLQKLSISFFEKCYQTKKLIILTVSQYF